jgi:geranylgeranyl diphosphate synthase type II
VVAGAIAGGAHDIDVARLKRFGETIGWAFQVVDDILDVEESSAVLGKTAGKDAAQNKATYPALYGLDKSREFARELESRAMAELEAFDARATRLHELAELIVHRRA